MNSLYQDVNVRPLTNARGMYACMGESKMDAEVPGAMRAGINLVLRSRRVA